MVTSALAGGPPDRLSAVALGGVVGLVTPAFLVRVLQSRYQRQFLNAFPDALDLIVRAVRAGLPAPEAMELVTREIQPPVGSEFQRMLDEMRIGIDMEETLRGRRRSDIRAGFSILRG